jgi:hypothetical protein
MAHVMHPFSIMESIDWNKDIDAALKQANDAGKVVLLDFSAAPM